MEQQKTIEKNEKTSKAFNREEVIASRNGLFLSQSRVLFYFSFLVKLVVPMEY